MNAPLQTILLNQMRAKNPEGYKAVIEAQSKGTSPQQLVREMMQKASPEQIQQMVSQAQSIGVPDSVIQELQNFK